MKLTRAQIDKELRKVNTAMSRARMFIEERLNGDSPSGFTAGGGIKVETKNHKVCSITIEFPEEIEEVTEVVIEE